MNQKQGIAMYRMTVIAVILLFLCLPAAAFADAFESLFSPGELSQAHSEFDQQCNQCHDKADKGKQDQLCLDCHDAHDSEMGMLLTQSQSKLCFTCHRETQTQKGRYRQHRPFARGDCSSCHAPHGGETPGL